MHVFFSTDTVWLSPTVPTTTAPVLLHDPRPEGAEINSSNGSQAEETASRTPAVFKLLHLPTTLQGLWVIFFSDSQTFKDFCRPGSPTGLEV